MAIAAADLRVRMLDSANRYEANGAIKRRDTAHGNAAAGSKLKPDVLVLDAAPDAAARISLRPAMKVSESPPGRRCRDPGRRARPPRWPAAPRTPGRKRWNSRRPRSARCRQMRLLPRRTSKARRR